MSRNTKFWLHGLASAFIGGGASAVTAMVVDPEHFNVHGWAGITRLFDTMVVSGALVAIGYLKQSPLPPLSQRRPKS